MDFTTLLQQISDLEKANLAEEKKLLAESARHAETQSQLQSGTRHSCDYACEATAVVRELTSGFRLPASGFRLLCACAALRELNDAQQRVTAGREQLAQLKLESSSDKKTIEQLKAAVKSAKLDARLLEESLTKEQAAAKAAACVDHLPRPQSISYSRSWIQGRVCA